VPTIELHEIILFAKEWIRENIENHTYTFQHKTSCSFNARLCWALIHGNIQRLWVDNPSAEYNTGFSVTTIHRWNEIRLNWMSSELQTTDFAMYVRFVASNDGHSLVLHKNVRTGVVSIFQAFHGAAEIQLLERDIFEDGVLIKKLLAKENIYAIDFQIETTNRECMVYSTDECYFMFQTAR